MYAKVDTLFRSLPGVPASLVKRSSGIFLLFPLEKTGKCRSKAVEISQRTPVVEKQ